MRCIGFQCHGSLEIGGACIVELCGSRLNPFPCLMALSVLLDLNSQGDDAKFFEFSKNAEDGPSRAGGFSKAFPEVPIEFRVCGKQESRLIILFGTRNSRGL